ncbi:unnamed protein product, partial [Notodromas monacha]
MLLRQQWKDPRLSFLHYLNSTEWQDVSSEDVIIDGEAWFAEKLWTPHIIFVNEHDSSVFDFSKENVYVAIDADGNVYFNCRLRVQFYCEIDLTLFPFDDQTCRLKMESWTLTEKDLVLKWMTPTSNLNSVEVADEFSMSEYDLYKVEAKEHIYNYPHYTIESNPKKIISNADVRLRPSTVKGNVKAFVGVQSGKVFFKD